MDEWWNTTDLHLWGYDVGPPAWWEGVGVTSLTWEGHWELAACGFLPEALFLFELAHVRWLEVLNGSMPQAGYRHEEVVMRFHDCTALEKWSDDLVSMGGAEHAVLRVRLRIGELELLQGGVRPAWQELVDAAKGAE